MRLVNALLAIGAAFASVVASPAVASADPLVGGDPVGLVNSCKPSKDHPYPAILVHGQSGDWHGMNAIYTRLINEGFCVHAMNHGYVPGGANGQDHLWISGDQIGSFIRGVMSFTGAKFVDVIGHSAGTGVLDNVVLKQGLAGNIHSFISFGGLHHPYAHFGFPRFADFDVHLPNLLAFGQKIFPGITVKQITGIIAGFGLDPAMTATVTSPFVEDLFDANYWNDLHGGPSEPPGTFVRLFTNGRTLPTHDSEPGICYTNIVGLTDLLVGGSTGWQDQTPAIDNWLQTAGQTGNTHSDMIGEPTALDKMMEGLKRNCGNGSVGTKSVALNLTSNRPRDPREIQAQKDFEAAFIEAGEKALGRKALSPSASSADDGEPEPVEAGCSISHPSGDDGSGNAAPVLLVLVAGLGVALRRRPRTAA